MSETTIIKKTLQDSASPTFNFASIEEQAKELVDKARIEANRMVEKARSEVQKIREEQHAAVASQAYDLGFKEGHEKGLTKGEAEGFEAGEKKALSAFNGSTKDTAKAIILLAEDLAKKRTELLDEARCDLLDAGIDLAVKATATLVLKDDSLRTRASEMVKLLADKTNLKIYVCPDDFKQMESLLPEVSDTLRHNEAIELLEDEKLSRGAVRVTSGKAVVDSDPVAIVDAIVAEITSTPEALL